MSEAKRVQAEQVRAVKEKWQNTLSAIPGVNSVGIANNHILVRVADRATAAKIPKTIDGVEVRVLIGSVRLLDAYTGRYRPVPGGVSIGNVNITAGTLSCLVKENKTGQLLGLSNAHVMNTPYGPSPGDPKGTPVVQPGSWDGGQAPQDTVGYTYKWVTVKPPPTPNLVDCACFKPTNTAIVSDRIIDVNLRPLNPVDPTLNMKVMKVGRTTGLTHSKVSVVDVNGEQIGDASGTLLAVFNDVFEIHTPIPALPTDHCAPGSFGCGGDSGSTILEEDTSLPVGLLFAGGYAQDEGTGQIYNIIVGCKATNVAKLLDVSFLEPVTTAGLSFLASFSLTLLFSALLWPRK